MTSAPKRTTDADFERELALNRALLDLSAASACLSDFRDSMECRFFSELTYEIWSVDANRLHWLVERVEHHVAELARIFYRENIEQLPAGAEERP